MNILGKGTRINLDESHCAQKGKKKKTLFLVPDLVPWFHRIETGELELLACCVLFLEKLTLNKTNGMIHFWFTIVLTYFALALLGLFQEVERKDVDGLKILRGANSIIPHVVLASTVLALVCPPSFTWFTNRLHIFFTCLGG